MLVIVFFFFKQKTAYEMRISDWSSEVCSSDLLPRVDLGQERRLALPLRLARGWCGSCPERHEEVRDRRGGNRSHQTRECVDGLEELFHVGRGELTDRLHVAERPDTTRARDELGLEIHGVLLVRRVSAVALVPVEVVIRRGAGRSEERRVGEEGVCSCRYGWA